MFETESSDENSYSTRYQIGISNVKEDVQLIECQELIVTISNNTVSIDPIALRHMFPSREFYHYCQLYRMKTHMHRLIPELEDDGSIIGSSLMYCLQVYYSFKPNTIAAKGKDTIS